MSPLAAGQSTALARDDPKNSAQSTSMGGGQSPPRWFPQAGPDPRPTRGGFRPPVPPDGKAGWALDGGPTCMSSLPAAGKAGSPWLLSKRSVSYCAQEGSLTPLQASPHWHPRQLLGSSQVLSAKQRAPWRLPNFSSYWSRAVPPPGLPRGCSPAFWLPSRCRRS